MKNIEKIIPISMVALFFLSFLFMTGALRTTSIVLDTIIAIFMFIISIVVAIYILKLLGNNEVNKNYDTYLYADLSDKEIKKFFPEETSKTLKEKFFKNYVEVQKAYSNFDNKKLRQYVTDELFNIYTTKLEVIKNKKTKKVLRDFKNNEIKISEIKEEDEIISVKVFLTVELYDYIINEQEIVIKGSDEEKITRNYELTFVTAKDKNQEITNCPNCGSKLTDKASQVCTYCGSTIVKNSVDFVLSRKKIL